MNGQVSASNNKGVLPSDIPIHNSIKYNRFMFNPTFSLVRENKNSINIYNRNPRASFSDNSQTYLLNYTATFDEQTGVGIGLFQQNVGIFRYFGATLNYAYKIALNSDMNFTFGVDINYSQSGLKSNLDQAHADDLVINNYQNNSVFLFHPGVNFNYGNFDVGVSVGNAAAYNLTVSELLTDSMIFSGHLMYTTNLDFRSDNEIRAMGYASKPGDEELRYGGNVIFELLKYGWAQLGYNSFHGGAIGIGANITKQVSVGYTVEPGIGGSANVADFGATHEFGLAYNFVTEKRKGKTRKTSQKAYESRDSEVRRLKKEILELNELIKKLREQKGDSIQTQRAMSKLERTIEETKNEEARIARELELKRIEEVKLLNKKAEEEALAAQSKLELEMAKQKAEEEEDRLSTKKTFQVEFNEQLTEEERIAEEEAQRESEAAKQQIEEDRLAAKKKLEVEFAEQKAEEELAKQEAEAARLAEEELAKQEAEAARLAEEELAKQEAEAARLAEEELAKQEAEAARLAEEELAKQEAEAARLAEEELAKQEAEAARLAEEELAKQEAEAARLAEEELAKQEAEAARLAEEKLAKQEAEAARIAEEERLKQEAEAARIAAANSSKEEGIDEIKKELDKSSRITKKIFARRDSLLTTSAEVDNVQFNEILESLATMNNDAEEVKKDVDPTSSKKLSSKNRFVKFAETTRPEAQIATKFIAGYPEGYHLIGNVFKGGEYASKFTQRLKDIGFDNAQTIINQENQYEYVSITSFENKESAIRQYLNNIDNRFYGDMWILHIAKSRVESYKKLLQETKLIQDTVKDDTVMTENLSYIGGHNIEKGYYLITNIFKRENYFERGMSRLKSQGLEPQFFRNPKDNYIYVYLKRFNDLEEAKQSLFSNVNNTYNGDLYILKIQ